MEAKIKDHSAIDNEDMAKTGANHAGKEHRTDDKDEQQESSDRNGNLDSSKPKGFADKANTISTLNEDKSTISDTSAPSASMQDKQ